MRLIHAESILRKLGEPLITTSDAAAALAVSRSLASKTLSRLEAEKRAVRLKRGRWVLVSSDRKKIDPWTLAEHLTTPAPAYISLQTALFYHGMISQIPQIIYAVSLAPTSKYQTALGTFSIHHLSPNFFFGYELVGKQNIKMAIPEKALLDLLYLTPTKSRLFAVLPELELPKSFSKKVAYEFLNRIQSKRRQSLVARRLEEIMH
jgi:predicted transcriptional regulator of viral defense system